MTGFVETLRNREKAEEDLYFQRLDRKLIEALHRKAQAAGTDRRPDTAGRGGNAPAPEVSEK